ncbi:MAG: hypothetical protein ACI836_001570, partial [Saprospiraceae bacterium]
NLERNRLTKLEKNSNHLRTQNDFGNAPTEILGMETGYQAHPYNIEK